MAKKTRWEREYYVGFHKDGPCIGNVCTDEGDQRLPELFSKRSHALKYFDDVRKVRIVEVK